METKKTNKRHIILRLINDEMTSKKVLSANACMSDSCAGFGAGTDICPHIDTEDCKQWAQDSCKYVDRAACAGVGIEDLCEYDYASGGLLCDPSDICGIDLA